MIGDWKGPGTLVLVTHQVNVTALTDVFPASGEMVVLRPDGHADRANFAGFMISIYTKG